ncbi:Ig-like domain-containing protein [Variovorax sp. ZT5P49]|uniref:Ig-like domain-containing protein n=2 Tax=unclassified Variovorax TaxID=663243 RepID=UPI003F47399E
MIEFEVIGKRGGGVRKALVNETTLDQASVVRIGLPQGQIKGMRRVGNDLVITAVSGEVITVREFFTSFDGNKSDLVLSDDEGGLWLAKLGEGQGALAAEYSSIDSVEPLLLQQDFNFGVLPWLVGGGLALAGAAGGGGGGGGQQLPVLPLAAPGDTTPPGRPTVNPANASSITGTAEPGTIVKVTDSAGKEIGSATVAPDGSYVVHPTTPPPHGMELRVVAVDRAGNASPDARTTVDSTPPLVPTVDPTDGSPITGTAEPGSVVTVIDANGTVIGQVTAAQNGAYSITPATPLSHGTVINVVAADAVGNVSQPATTTVDSAAPARPTVNPTDGSPVTGTAEPGSLVTIKDSAGKVIGSATAAPNGTYAVTPTTPPPHGTVISVVATDPAGNASLPATATVDSKAPDAPTVSPTAGSPITGTAEAGTLVTIRDDSGKLVGSATVTANGTYSVTPATPPANGTQLRVVATDAAGNASPEARTTVDSARPDAPTVNPTDGSPITGTAEAGAVVTIKDGLGNVIGSTTAAVNGAYSFTPAKPPADGTVINVVATDAAGNASLPATTKVDSTPPAAPTVSPTNGNPITGTAEAGSVVTIKDGLGNVIGSMTAGPNGTYAITPTQPPADGTVINVVATDAAGNASQPATATVDSTPPAAPKVNPTNGNQIAGTAEAGAVVTIKDDSGKVIGSATVAANGTYSITPATPPADGAVLHVAATDAAGNTSPETKATVDRTPPGAPKIHPTDGDPITGTAEPGSVVTIKDGLGNIVGSATAAANGTYRVTPATVPADGTVLHVVATDAAGNTSPEATTEVDSTAVDMPTVNPTSGRLITGVAEAGSLVTIKDGAGNLIGSATAGPNGTYSVTPAATLPDGTVLHVVATDAAGNPSPEATATVDSKPPAAPTINPTNGSAITGTAEADSVVTIKDGAGNVVGTTVAINGKYSIAPAATLPEGTVLRAAAADAAGNTSPESTATVDRTAPVVSVAIVNDANNDGFINASEKGADVTVKVTLVSGAAVGDVISLTDGTATPSVTLTAADVANGFVNVSFANPAEGRTLRVSATSRDLAGNVSTSAVADSAVFDTTPPAAVIAAVTDNAGPVRGPLANGGTTDDTMPTFGGSGAAPGDVIKVFDNGSVIGSATVDASGSWSVKPGTPLGEGAHSITQTATDAAGNTSAAGAPLDFKVDTTGVPVSLKLAPGRQPKTFPDGFTDETSPTLEGKTTAGAVVTVTEGANVLGSTKADASGNWRLALPVQSEGAHQYTATAVNAAGTNSKAALALTIDASPPAVPSIAEVMDDAGSVRGPLANGGFTDDTTPTFAGSGATPGDKIRIYDNGIAIGSTTVEADGSWKFAFTGANTPLKEGVHRFTATALDPVGNESAQSPALIVTVDTSAPPSPAAATSYADNVGPAENAKSTAASTNDTTPGINVGQVEDGLTPSLYIDGVKVPAVYDRAAGTLTPSAPLGEGEHRLSYTLTDQAGNESPRSGDLMVTVDTTPPPVLDASSIKVLDNEGAVQGELGAGAKTDDSKPEYLGKADPKQVSSINVYDNGKLIGNAEVRADGSWRFEPNPPLAEGDHSFTARAVDAAGNVGAATPASTFTLLGVPPAVPAITGVSDDKGNLGKDASTNDTTLTLSGTGTAGTVVTVIANGKAVGSTSVAANGTWSVTTEKLGADGVQNLSATAKDGAGRVSPETGPYPVVLDTTPPPTPSVVAATDGQGLAQGPITADGVTDDASPTFGGNGVKAGDTVRVYDGNTLIGSITVATDGAWSVAPSKQLGDGRHSITHTITDAAGNTSAASAPLVFTVDTKDVIVSIGHAEDNQGDIKSNLVSGARTDDTTPTLVGKTTPGAVVTVKEGTTDLGSTTADANGNWRLELPAQREGAHEYKATAVNAAGTGGTATIALTIDTTPPAAPSIAGVGDDVGSVQSPLANGDFTDDTTPTLSGSGATAGDVIKVYDNGSFLGTTTVKADGSWSFTTSPLAEGPHRLTATATDAVGNESPHSGSFTVNVDVTPPPPPAAATSYEDDAGAVKNPASVARTTDDTTPGLNIGTLAAGLTPSLYVDGTKVAATYDPATGTLTPANPLGEGTHQLSYTLTDAAGNESKQSPSLAITVDTTAPATPAAATGYADDAGAIRNPASVVATTDDTTPGINIGAVPAGSTPSLYVDGTKVDATYDLAAGTLTPTNPLGEGAHQISYTLTDAAGNESKPSPALAITVDTTAPAAPAAATSYADDAGAIRNPASVAGISDDTTPGINIGTVPAGSTPSLYVGGTKVAATYDPATGTLTPTNPLGEGTHQLSYTLTDPAGNESPRSGAFTLNVDITAPAALDPSLIQVLDDVGAVTGPIATGAQTDDSKPVYTGKADATQVSSINVYDNGKLIGNAEVRADGSWRFEPNPPLAEGDHSFTARAVDAAGNVGAATPASTFTLLGDAPSAPAITGVSDDKGNLGKDASTNDTTLTLSGTGTAGTVVIVRANDTDVGSTSVAANGTWSVTTSPLSGDGVKNLSAVAVDGAGRSSPETGSYPIMLDTTPPATPGVVVATDDQGAVTGPIVAGGSTDDASPTFGGSGAKAGDTVRVYDGATLLGSATVKADGSWSFTPSTPLGQGAHSITHTLTDAAGNTSVASAPLDFKVDTTDVVVSIVQALDDKGSKQGNLASGSSTDDTTPTLVGTATPGAAVTVKEGAALLGSTTADANGNWSLTLPVQGEGAHNYTATAVNAAGKNGEASLALTIDTSAPNVPAIGGATDDVGSVQGPLANGGVSDDTTPTLTGSSATPGDVIQVYDNGSAIGSTTVKADGSWSFTPTTPLAEGAHRLTATAIDSVGNESRPSGDFVVNVDTTAPAIKATLGAISTDTGTSNSDFVTSDRTLVVTVTVDSAMETGATVQVSLDNGKTWNNATPTGGSTYQYDSTATSLPDGSHTFLTRVVDAAGNATQAISQVVVIDNSGPTTDNAVAITAYTDDVAPNTGEYGSGTSTNDTTPVLKGTVDGLKTGDVVQIYEGTVLLGTATVTNTTWTFATPALANGSAHTYTAVIADAAGNKGTASADFTLTVHTGLPLQSVAITGYTDNEDPQQGTFASGSTTNDTSPQLGGTLAGTLVAGEVVAVYRDGVRLGAATMTSAATWTFQDAGLVDGTSYSYTARVEDGAGNRGGASAAFTLTVDQSAPTAAPSIDSAMDDVAPVTGPITSGSTTNDTRPELKGAGAEPNGTVRVYDNGTLIGTATADSTGKWSFTPEAGKELANGVHNLTTSNVDAAGNEGPKSTPLTFTVDTIAPTQSTVVTAVNDDLDPQRGVVANNGHTNDLTPQVAGTISAALNAGETVVVLRDGAVVGTATMTDATNWTFNDAGLSNGQTYSYTARVEDAGGNRGAISGSYAINIDTSVPKQVVTISTVFDNVDPGQGNIANGGTTNDSQPELRGTLSIGLGGTEVVVVYRDGARIGNASVSGTSWSFIDATGLVNASSYSYTARVENAAGSAGAASSPYAITLQTTGSATTATITAVTDDVDPQQGTVANNGETNDTTPQVAGSIAAELQAGEKVVVLRDGVVVGTATMTDATHWTYADSGLAAGATYVYTARIQDAAANPGADSNAYTIHIDTTAPTQRVVLTRAIDNVDPVSGDIPANGSTNDDTPTLEGTLSVALSGTEQLHVFRNGAHVGIAKVTGTAWTFEDASLSSGTTYTYEARVMDAAGNAGPASNSLSFTVNTSGVTQTVQILRVLDNTEPVIGNLVNGSVTNETRPLLSGSISTALNAGDVVEVLRNDKVIGTATVTGTTWYLGDTGLADGMTYNYTARVVNSGGNQGAQSAAYAITIDRTAPTQTVAITSYTDDQDPQQGTFTSGSTTNDATPQLNGTFAGTLGAGEVVAVYRDGVRLGAATVTGAATWTFQDAGLVDGTSYSYIVRVEDAAGNQGATSAAFTLTVDQSVPTAAPSIDSAMDDTEPVIGPITPGGTTNDTRPELKGAGAEPNGTVRVYDNGTLIGTATADGTGKWSFTPAVGSELANGAHSLAVSNVDAAGNEGPKSASLAFTVGTVAPSTAPSIDSVMDDIDPVQGPITSGSTTNDTRPELKGSGAQPNGIVRIYDNGTLIGTATADGAGKWSFTPEAGKELANGAHSLTTSNVDAAGNEGPKSTPLVFAVDTVAPSAAPSIDSVMDNTAPVTGPITSGSTTNETRPVLQGAGAEPNGIVRIYDNDTLIGTATADGAGKWSFTPAVGSDLANGTHSLTTSNVDAAGNEGPKSTPLAFAVDTAAPSTAPSVDSVMDNTAPVTGPITSGSTTNETRPVLQGAGAEPNGTVRIYDNGTLIGSATADGTGKWSFTPEAGKELANGAHSLTTSNVDAAGNEGPRSAPLAFTVDTVAPSTAPSVDSVMDNIDPVSGPITSGSTTNETRPVLKGAGAEPNGIVRIYDNGTLIGSATADGTGNWSFTPEPGKELANGAHSLATSNVDAAGNEGPKSTALTFTVDTVAPPVATLSLGNYSDSFPAAGTLAANQSSDHNSNDNTFDLVLTGADASTASYEVSTDGGLVWKATTAAQNNLSDGKYLFRATLTDAAGNSTAAANNIVVTVDRTSPGLDLQRVSSTLVSGTTEAGALVAIDVGNNGSVEASVTADANGNWTWTPSTPIAANTVVSAVAYDLAGNASSKGTQMADTTPPAVTIQKSDGNSFSGTTSDADMPVVSPTATRPITVRLSVDSNADGVVDYVLPFTATVTADGTWSIDAKSAPVNVGAIVTAVAQDYNGNLSAPATVTVGGGTSKISGSASHDNFGYDVQAIGDFNGDGYNDFAVVAPHGSSAQRSANKWSVNILYGSKQGLPDLSDIAHLPGTDGLKIYTSGDISDSNILTAVQGYGDVNGDGYSDVIVYDDNLDSDWVIFGRASDPKNSAPVNVDVRTIISSGGNSDGVAIVRRDGSSWFGAGGALTDVNGDGYADIIVQDWNQGTGSAGTAIIYGHAGAAGTAAWANYFVGFTGSKPSSYVSDSSGSSTESSRPHTVIYNDNTNGYPVNVVNIGDINGDGYSDFAYSLYNARNSEGKIDDRGNIGNAADAGAIQVIYGKGKNFEQDYSLQTDYSNIANGFRVYGEEAKQFLGTYIDPEPYGYLSNTGMPTSSGDVNGDGIADLIIGSPQFGPDAGEQRGPGRVYVVYGKAGGVNDVNLAFLSPADGFVITASDSTPDAMFGNGTSVGDFNGDGIDDIAIGAPLADIGGINTGAVYIVYGQQGGYSGTMSVAATYSGAKLANSASFTYRQNGDADSGSMLGVNVALSDLNGDGQADLALGSAYQGTRWTPAAGYLEVVYADAFNFTNLMTVGDDVIKATAGRDRLSGGAGNDVITGVQAGDSAYGGAGNDSIHINEINGVVRVDGGLGIDTLAIDSSNVTLDLSQLGLKVKGFENFDLGRGAGNTGNVLKLRIADVLSQQSSTGTGNGAGQGHLRVTGDASDTVELLRGSDSWSNTGTTNVGGVNYSIYHNSTLPAENTLGDIWIQQGVTVVVNSGGNQQAPTQTVAITSYTDDQGSSKGSFGSGTTTDDANPVLNGTLAGSLGASEVVAVYRDGARLGNATMTGAATWTFEDAGLADGKTYSYTARVENAVSNRGGAWAAFTITVDYAVTVNSQVTVDTTPLVTGTMPFKLTNGEFIEVTVDGKTYSSANGAVVVDSQHNTWYVQVPSAIALGTYDVKAVVKSAAGVLIASDDTKGELIVSAAPTVTVGSAASDPNQKATAYTLGENGMWRIHTNQTMLDANGTNNASLGNFKQTALKSNSTAENAAYVGPNYVQNATFMDFDRDGHMDLFAEDSTYDDGQQAFIFDGSNYKAVQVGGPAAVKGDWLTAETANTFSWFGGVIAFDKTGDGSVDLAYGDQTPDDATARGGHNTQIVLNPDGSILGMVKDRGYTYTKEGTYGAPESTNAGNATFGMELSGVDLNNDGTVDIVYHATIGTTKIGGPSATPFVEPQSDNAYRLVVATNKGDGTWDNTQIIEKTFQSVESPSYGNGISLTWADFNGDGYMDLFMGRGYGVALNEQYQSRILFNDGQGQLGMLDLKGKKGVGAVPAGMHTFGDGLQGGPSLAVDWNGDGKMDVVELPGFGVAGGMTTDGNTGPINLYTNTRSGGTTDFTTINLVVGWSNTIGKWTGDPNTNDAVTGAIAADIDWDGDRDLLAFTQKGNTKFIANTNTVADGTSLHFRILDAQGINALYGNTVQLFDSKGKLVATQMINPQSGNQTNDSSAIVDFYGLDAKETYTLALLRIANGKAADVGGLGNLGGNTIENVNAAWTGLKAGEANHAFVLTTESGSNVADANIGNGIVGTGYNDTFFATQGSDKYEGGGGAVTVSGVRAWSNTGGIDIVDYKLADSAPLTIDLGNTGAQNTGFGTATFKNIEGLAGGSGADTFTDNAGDNVFEGRAGNDTFKLTGGGKDTLLYKLLATTDATGGNGADAVSSFEVGTFEATANADRIELKDLLVGYTADADGAARYINGVATIDSGDAIGNYLSVTVSGGNTTLNIDRDGSGSAYSATALITLNGVTTDLATLLANHQLVLA